MLIKSREAVYCNLKLFLLYLVVLGHIIEPCIGESVMLYELYRMIYFVHMPLFVFLSGYFTKSKEQCFQQGKRALIWYLGCQGIAMLLQWLVKGYANPLWVPYWHLWYLLSLFFWSLMGMGYYWIIKRCCLQHKNALQILCLFVAIVIGCLSGVFQGIGRGFSLSRTMLFLPYYLAGVFCGKEVRWSKWRGRGLGALICGLTLCYLTKDMIGTVFLYQVAAYGVGKEGIGIIQRLLCYLIGSCLGFFLLTWMPECRFCFTKAGADTMKLYVLHGPVVKGIWLFFDWKFGYYLVAPFLSVGILWILYKAFQWNGQLFMIRGKEYGGV